MHNTSYLINFTSRLTFSTEGILMKKCYTSVVITLNISNFFSHKLNIVIYFRQVARQIVKVYMWVHVTGGKIRENKEGIFLIDYFQFLVINNKTVFYISLFFHIKINYPMRMLATITSVQEITLVFFWGLRVYRIQKFWSGSII